MRKLLCTVALSGLLGFGVTAALAQDASSQQQPATAPPMHGPRHQMGSPDAQLARLTKKLNLTSDQQTQIKPLLENQQQQIMQVHQDQSLSRQDRMSKVQSIHEDTKGKIEAVLNDDQKQKYETMEQKMQERHQRGQGAQTPQQPQAQPQPQ
jgi:Spy/CpxP family protein refolding chaperone